MRTRIFEVPKDMIPDFFTAASEADLETELLEISEDEELVVEVSYNQDDRDEVLNLIELLDDYYEKEEVGEDDAESRRR